MAQQEYATAARKETQSNLPTVIEGLANASSRIRGMTTRLRTKNDQLMWPLPEEAVEYGNTSDGGKIHGKPPLLGQLNDELTTLHMVLSELDFVIEHTLTI